MFDYNSRLNRFRSGGPSFVDHFIPTLGYHLNAQGRDITREQFAELVSIAPIRTLSIAATPRFSDDWFIGLDAPGMLALHLNDVNLTDRSVDSIASMRKLTNLALVNTAVSDAAVDRLIKLPVLSRIQVGGPNIRATRLLDREVVDEAGQPALRAGGSLHVRGRLAIDGLHGNPRTIRVMIPSKSDNPPWQSEPYGWFASRRGVGIPVEEAPGIWKFDVTVGFVPPGKSTVEVWVEQLPPASITFLHYHLEPFSIDLAPEVEGRNGVAESIMPR